MDKTLEDRNKLQNVKIDSFETKINEIVAKMNEMSIDLTKLKGMQMDESESSINTRYQLIDADSKSILA